MPRKQEKTALESLTQPFGKLRDLLRLVSLSNHVQDDEKSSAQTTRSPQCQQKTATN